MYNIINYVYVKDETNRNNVYYFYSYQFVYILLDKGKNH